MRFPCRRVEPRVARDTAAHAAGDFVTARELAREIVSDGDPSLEVIAVPRATLDLLGLPLPPLTEQVGIAIGGILSHGFLRRYAWTLDFEAMTMTFSTPDP